MRFFFIPKFLNVFIYKLLIQLKNRDILLAAHSHIPNFIMQVRSIHNFFFLLNLIHLLREIKNVCILYASAYKKKTYRKLKKEYMVFTISAQVIILRVNDFLSAHKKFFLKMNFGSSKNKRSTVPIISLKSYNNWAIY